MTTLRVLFKVRYQKEMYPQEFEELVDVESDSTPEEQDQQIKEYYYDYYIKLQDRVAQTYLYTILN